jgi:type II restriction/modification system DNA methylase subunit YeeA
MKGLNLIRNLTTGTPQIRLNDMRQIPIPPYKENNDIEDLVDKMLSLNKELRDLPENSEKWLAAKSEIEKTDRKIDEEVYKIYGLTEEEIKIVEG